MKSARFALIAFALAQWACVGVAMADEVIQKPVAADTPEKFAATVTDIHKQMETGGRYEYIKADDKAKVDVDLNTMAALLQKSGSVSAMPDADRLKLFNTQEHVNGLLAHNDENRLVCTRETHVGSNMPVTTCKTVANIELTRRNSQQYTRDALDRGNPFTPAGNH
jgi:hypothetical protein